MATDNNETQAVPDEQIESYDQLIDRLKDERDAVKERADRDYREAKRYVRSHPEEGVLAAFIGGLALGIVIGKLSK